jgi:hypothetical protein
MTPQHSSPPGRAFRFGIFARLYVRMKCYKKHNSAIYGGLFDTRLRDFRSGLSSSASLVRYSYHCFEHWLNYLTSNLFYPKYPPGYKGTAHGAVLCVPYPPGGPHWCNFTNYSNTKNRPFINPSSWTVPVTWRSSERK